MNNWDVIELNKLGEFRNGANYPKGSYGKGDKIVNVKDLFKGRFVNYENLDELKFDALSNKTLYLVQHGDLLFTRSSLVKSGAGMVAMINEPHEDVLFCGFIIRFRPDLKKVNPLYLLYLLRSSSYRKLFTDGSVQTNISNINQETLGGIKVYLPSLSNQNQIIKILDNLDTKIELNNLINRELEAMAKTLYDYWFVQFDFPNEQGKPYKSSGGKMVYNAELKREIPEGWEAGNIGNYCPSTGGFAFKSSWWTNEGVSVVKIKDIQEDYTIDISNLAKVDLTGKNIDNKFKAKPGDILIAMTGATVGKYGIVPITDYPIYVNQRVGYFNLGKEPSEKLPYLINSLNQPYFREMIFALASGAAQPNISNEQINRISIVIPDRTIVNNYNLKFSPFYMTILNNQRQNQQLTELRDWLLPMLMNGQVTVKEAEERLSMAAEPGVEYKKG